ncbi:hypothetical protein MRBLMN1_001743 [Chitinophaga ginsengisegetis]|uniref:hypothetical protein n=1 Tax=Chitinophaga ginsengisegetis TaxID=393003 RepID=UPI00342FD9A5
MQSTKTVQTNPLRSLLEGFAGSAVKFREKVCEECGWSESTFYKKARETRHHAAVFSIAEMEKIKDLAWEVQQELKDRL